jgi:CheY-like chemotaxis protein
MAEILVVDDDPDFCEITRTILAGAGHKVQTASSGDQALKSMRQQAPELVVLDVMMSSVLDGLDLSDRMQSDSRLKKVPIIMVSSIASSEYASMFPTDAYLPVDSWLSKPVAPQVLVSRVSELLAKR